MLLRFLFFPMMILIAAAAMPTNVHAQGIHCGGSLGEGCLPPAQRKYVEDRVHRLPCWGGPCRPYGYGYGAKYQRHYRPPVYYQPPRVIGRYRESARYGYEARYRYRNEPVTYGIRGPRASAACCADRVPSGWVKE